MIPIVIAVIRAMGFRKQPALVTQIPISSLTLNEVVCAQFGPGPALNPWIVCMKDRAAGGESVGGCIDGLLEQALLAAPKL
jgi:hypothetical protein